MSVEWPIKTKAGRRFELLDERLIDIQGKLKKAREEIDSQAHDNEKRFTRLEALIKTGLDGVLDAITKIQISPEPDPCSTHLKLVRVQDVNAGLTVEGEITRMQITDSQQATIEFGAPVDKKGFPAQVQDGSVTFSVGDDSATVTQDATNPFKALVKGVHPAADPSTATVITISADADLGDGVTAITGTEPLLVTGGQATGFGAATVGTPEEQA